jgi:hypothetical protein
MAERDGLPDKDEKARLTRHKNAVNRLQNRTNAVNDFSYERRKVAALKQFGEVAEKGEKGKTYKIVINTPSTKSDTLVTWLGLVNNLLGTSLQLLTYSEEPDFIVREQNCVFVRVG